MAMAAEKVALRASITWRRRAFAGCEALERAEMKITASRWVRIMGHTRP